jgi:hypothetical protein
MTTEGDVSIVIEKAHWSDGLFSRQFRMNREWFFDLVGKLKNNYPGPYGKCFSSYLLSQIRGAAATAESGPVTMEIKLAITLRLLAGASYLDMVSSVEHDTAKF